MTQPKLMLFGDKEGVCQICFMDKHRFGSLLDPAGHIWLICADCIGTLWVENHAVIRDAEVEEKALELIRQKLLGAD